MICLAEPVVRPGYSYQRVGRYISGLHVNHPAAIIGEHARYGRQSIDSTWSEDQRTFRSPDTVRLDYAIPRSAAGRLLSARGGLTVAPIRIQYSPRNWVRTRILACSSGKLETSIDVVAKEIAKIRDRAGLRRKTDSAQAHADEQARDSRPSC